MREEFFNVGRAFIGVSEEITKAAVDAIISIGTLLDKDFKVLYNEGVGNYRVYIRINDMLITVGTIEKEDFKWFDPSPNPLPENIKTVMYLGNYRWGIKQFNSKISEFNRLTMDDQMEILDDYLKPVSVNCDYPELP